MPSLAHKRGTRAQIDAAAGASALKTGEVYLITDEARLTVGTAANAHAAAAKQGEGGGGSDPWTWQKLASDVANSTTTLAPVTGLSFTASANTTYLVELIGAFQAAMLDRAGELLAASTASVIAAVRDEAGVAGATAYLLVYLPTVLDPLAPAAKRANVPVGWASPAFDILQLEDYDWVTSGNHGATARAVPLMTQRLGYPVAEQHYFSGFVLRSEDEAQWAEIEHATVLSKDRGTAQTYVWALPQIARDGYTHFEIGEEEDDMQAFDDVTFPIAIGREAVATAEFSTNVVTTFSGHERRNSDWADARQKYDVGPGVRSEEELGALLAFFRARRGPAIGFRFTDPFDNSSNNMTGAPTALDQLLGIGDGVRTSFALAKTYGADGQIRRITRPQPVSVVVASNGSVASGWSLAETGIIQFGTAPAAGAVITAGFRFDVPVRFADDGIEISRATFGAGDMPSVPLIEIKEAV